jgi:iron-sulfur cluster repair protein YtfE (RIC family)
MAMRPDLTVNQLVLQSPGSLPALAALGVDTCCGGGRSLALAAHQAGLTFDQLVEYLQVHLARTAGDTPVPACGCGTRQV